MTKFIKTFVPTFLFFGSALSVWADLPAGKPITFTELDYIIARIANFLITTSVVLAVIYIVWSGITYMNAGANTTKVAEAQARLRAAVIGALIVLGVGVIINTLVGLVTREFFCTYSVMGVCIVP